MSNKMCNFENFLPFLFLTAPNVDIGSNSPDNWSTCSLETITYCTALGVMIKKKHKLC